MRALTYSIKYFLVQKLGISNKEAINAIVSKRVLVNGNPTSVNQALRRDDVITFDGKNIQEPKEYHYIIYNKPRGVETTLNTTIEQNLSTNFNFPERLFPVGRLDKESEGLLLLTNDGFIFDKILHSKREQEKEYLVIVDKPLTPEAISKLSSGITILGKTTRPAIVNQTDENSFSIILTQGINRQIRRMCYKLGYEVTKLQRTRIINLKLGDLAIGNWRELNRDELSELRKAIEKQNA